MTGTYANSSNTDRTKRPELWASWRLQPGGRAKPSEDPASVIKTTM